MYYFHSIIVEYLQHVNYTILYDKFGDDHLWMKMGNILFQTGVVIVVDKYNILFNEIYMVLA